MSSTSRILKQYPADVVRTALMIAGEGLDDASFEFKTANSIQRQLSSWYSFVQGSQSGGTDDYESIDGWLESVTNRSIKKATDCISATLFKSALNHGFFEIQRNLRWYLRRKVAPNRRVMSKVIEVQIRLLWPFAPHICEEIWSQFESQKSTPSWPEYEESKVDDHVEKLESILQDALEDINNVLKFPRKRKQAVRRPYLYVVEQDLELFSSIRDFLGRELATSVEVQVAANQNRYDPKDRASRAALGKPGIYFE